jgi:hypothetical protein
VDGLNWTTAFRPTPTGTENEIGGVAYDAATNTIYAFLKNIGTDNILTTLYSTDFGVTWQTRTSNVGANIRPWLPMTQAMFDPSRNRIVFGIAQLGTLGTGYRALLQSKDGGATWTDAFVLDTIPGTVVYSFYTFACNPEAPNPIIGRILSNLTADGTVQKHMVVTSNRVDDTFESREVVPGFPNPYWRSGEIPAYSPTNNRHVYTTINNPDRVYSVNFETLEFNEGSLPGIVSNTSISTIAYYPPEDVFFLTTTNSTQNTSNTYYPSFKSKFGHSAWVREPAPSYNVAQQFGMYATYDTARSLLQIYSQGYLDAIRNGMGYLGADGIIPTATPTPTPTPSLSASPVPNFKNKLLLFGDSTVVGRVYSVNMDDTFTQVAPSFGGTTITGSMEANHSFTFDNKNVLSKAGSNSANINFMKYAESGLTYVVQSATPSYGAATYSFDFTRSGRYMVVGGAGNVSAANTMYVLNNDGSNGFAATSSTLTVPAPMISVVAAKNSYVFSTKFANSVGNDALYAYQVGEDGVITLIHSLGAGLALNQSYRNLSCSADGKVISMNVSSGSANYSPVIVEFDGTTLVQQTVTLPFTGTDHICGRQVVSSDGSRIMFPYRQSANTAIPETGWMVLKKEAGAYVVDYIVNFNTPASNYVYRDVKMLDTEEYAFVLTPRNVISLKKEPDGKYSLMPESSFNVQAGLNNSFMQMALTYSEATPIPAMSPTPTPSVSLSASMTPTPSPSATPGVGFKVIVNNQKVITGDDALNGQSWRGITFSESQGKYFAVANSAPTGAALGAYSTDGLNWTGVDIKMAPGRVADTAYSPTLDIFVITNWSANGDRAWSTDAINWTLVNDAVNRDALFRVYWVAEVNLFVGIATGAIMTSADGKVWSKTVVGLASDTWRGFTYDSTNSLWIIGSSTGKVMTSPDGINWTQRRGATTANNSIETIVHDKATNTTIAFFYYANGGAAYSLDGSTWIDRATSNPTTTYVSGSEFVPSLGKVLLTNVSPSKFVDYNNVVINSGVGYSVLTSLTDLVWSERDKWAVAVGGNGNFCVLSIVDKPNPSPTPTPTPSVTPTSTPLPSAMYDSLNYYPAALDGESN